MSPSDREVSQGREVPVPSPPCRDLEAAGRHSLALHRLGARKAGGLPVPRSVLTPHSFPAPGPGHPLTMGGQREHARYIY